MNRELREQRKRCKHDYEMKAQYGHAKPEFVVNERKCRKCGKVSRVTVRVGR